MDGKQIYEEVKRENVPFFEWSKWIEQRFEKELFDQMYRKNKRQTVQLVSKIPGSVRI